MEASLESLPSCLPLVQELTPAPDPEVAFKQFAGRPHCLFLDSAMRHERLGRYSFLCADPFEYVELPVGAPAPLGQLRDMLAPFGQQRRLEGLPPFQGGAAGMFGYELGRSLERLPLPQHDEFGMPALAIGIYDTVIAWDHAQHRAWIISHGFPESAVEARRQKAQLRAQQLVDWLADKSPPGVSTSNVAKLHSEQLAPQFPLSGNKELTSDFSQAGYLHAVAHAIEYIRAGDVFQVNLSQRLLSPDDGDPISLYLRLRKRNPATFAAYFAGCDFQIASASPERFLQVDAGQVETRPIKGTRHRSRLPEADLFAADDLQASEKDRAENVMIVDLLRNDLSRVCRPDSVRVKALCRVEAYETVQHLVSVVEGKLSQSKDSIDLLRVAFPGGSITGAPKVRAMEIIAELEPTARGAYCGSIGYIGFDGTMDLNILIRTITSAHGWRQLPVGGGIVAQSEPMAEYEETWHKAAGMLRALE